MNNKKGRPGYISLGVGTADIFFILLAFFLTQIVPKEWQLFKLPMTADEANQQQIRNELSPWRMVVPPYNEETGLVFYLASIAEPSDTVEFTMEEAEWDTITYGSVKAIFQEFMQNQRDHGANVDSIRMFDIFAYFGSSVGVVFTAVEVCRDEDIDRRVNFFYQTVPEAGE